LKGIINITNELIMSMIEEIEHKLYLAECEYFCDCTDAGVKYGEEA